MNPTARTRADRLDLERRLQSARHAAELLHQKEEALARERVAHQAHATRAAERWLRACGLADEAVLRARMLGASGELSRLAIGGTPPAVVSIEWRHSMGLTTPANVSAQPGPAPRVASTAALGPAIDAVRDAVAAAASAAATDEALRRLDIELAATRRRRRAIADRLVPRLDAERHALDLRLDERDRDEALRVRIAGGGR